LSGISLQKELKHLKKRHRILMAFTSFSNLKQYLAIQGPNYLD